MPKTAADPYFATNTEPVSAGRRAMSFGGPDGYSGDTDLPTVSSSLIVTSNSFTGSISVIMANDPDGAVLTIPVPAQVVDEVVVSITLQIAIQVRQIVAVSDNVTVVALWS
jgi:hypothetical protein